VCLAVATLFSQQQAVQFAGTEQLAALGPTSVIFSFSSYVFNALGIATTTVISKQLASDDADKASASATASLCIALLCGLATFIVLQVLFAKIEAICLSYVCLICIVTTHTRVQKAYYYYLIYIRK
jgi:Na+-driven multidrug efflux pump